MEFHCALGFCVALLVAVIMAIALKAAANYFAPSFTVPQPILIIIGCIVLLLILAAFFSCFSGGEMFHWGRP